MKKEAAAREAAKKAADEDAKLAASGFGKPKVRPNTY